MHNDILYLMHFYNSPLGQITRRMLRQHIRQIWPKVHGERVLGIGYPSPYLRLFSDEAERVICAMPATQGVTHWPEDGKNMATLCDEMALPFEDYSIDRAIMIHAMEGCGDPNLLLQEAWRVLSGNGRLLLVVPNRMGLWARSDHTPFGRGLPYSYSQLNWLLRQELFTPLSMIRAMYAPPTQSRFWLSWHRGLEKIGRSLFPQFGGLMIIEAKKEVYSAHPTRYRRAKMSPVIFPGHHAPVTPPRP